MVMALRKHSGLKQISLFSNCSGDSEVENQSVSKAVLPLEEDCVPSAPSLFRIICFLATLIFKKLPISFGLQLLPATSKCVTPTSGSFVKSLSL